MLFGRIVLAEMVGFTQIPFVNLPFCAGPISLLEPLLTRQSTGLSRLTVAPFRVRIPKHFHNEIAMPYGHRYFMAEMVGFEPTCRLPDNLISSQARYDRFDTSPGQ